MSRGGDQRDERNERRELADLRARIVEQAEELGRLRAIAERVESLQAERDRLVQELAEARAAVDARVAQEVAAAVQAVRAEHEAAAARWAEERRRLEEQLASREEARAGLAGEGPQEVPTDVLAKEFQTVLEELSAPRPAPGRQSAAALTGLEVEARGVLMPPIAEGERPRLVTVDPTAVQPDALSAVRMRFSVLPLIPPPQ